MMAISDATGCFLMHRGGEACLYKVCAGGRSYSLKWYKEGASLDSAVAEKIAANRIAGIYRVVESGVRAGRPYLLYDFVEGVPADVLGRMPVAFALDSVRKIASALSGLSRLGIHHGDLNPANVIFGADGAPTLIDCGIVGPGALAYAAPERIQGRPASEKSDLYSLGMLLYSFIAGEPLVHGDCFENFAAAAVGADSLDPTSLLFEKGVDAALLSKLEPLWKGLLRANPDDRVEDLDELDELLEIAFDGVSGGDVVWDVGRRAFVESLSAKIGTNCCEGAVACPLPPEFAVTKATNRRKCIAVLAIVITILLMLALLFAFGTDRPSVDETGKRILLRSKMLEAGEVGTAGEADSAQHDGVSGKALESLPVPDSEGGAWQR